MSATLDCIQWMVNQEGQTPCVIAQEVGQLCNYECERVPSRISTICHSFVMLTPVSRHRVFDQLQRKRLCSERYDG